MHLTNFLKVLQISLAALVFSCRPALPPDNFVSLYIGTYTAEGSEGIYYTRFDTITGQITEPIVAAQLNNPSYLALSPCKTLLFAVGEGNGLTPNLYSYKIDNSTGNLTIQDSVSTGGTSSCYVSLVGCGMVAFANYSSGDVSFVQFNNNGQFTSTPVTFKHTGSGPNESRQKGPHAHSILADKNMNYIYAADLGADKLFVYQCNNDSVSLITTISVPPGAGPRHLDFHPSGKIMALLNELDHSVDVFTTDDQGIFSIKTQTIELLPDSLREGNWSADIHFSDDGKHLYASVRGINHIEVYTVDAQNKSIEWVSSVGDGINWPRNFTLDPTGNYLLVANQKGNDIVVLSRNKNTGELTPTTSRIEVSMPVCLKF